MATKKEKRRIVARVPRKKGLKNLDNNPLNLPIHNCAVTGPKTTKPIEIKLK
jgi:hypothetical protein